jgi:GT2 family glycosyltransferase
MNEKIGVGIVTCGREKMFRKLFESLLPCKDQIDYLYIVEDTKKEREYYENYSSKLIKNWKGKHITVFPSSVNLGVAKAKNCALTHLLDMGCEHIFLIEDDMIIQDVSVFQKYISASKKSGIQHFNFSQHGFANKIRDDVGNIIPNPKITVKYGDIGISFYQHCVGSFSYYSNKCLNDAGLMDEQYYNACEHVDHTYEIIKKGYHPPFWWFADIENSWEYIGDDGWSMETSSICSSPDFVENVKNSDDVFVKKHGYLPLQIPLINQNEIGKYLKEIKEKYERPDNSNL